MPSDIKFGTDGWRGLIAQDFTFENVRLVGGAIASYVLKYEDPKKGLVVGYDTRFLSGRFAEAIAEVLATAGIPVRLANHLEPQSLAVEWGEVQGEFRRIGDAGHHSQDRRRTRRDASRQKGGDRADRLQETLRRRHHQVRGSRCHRALRL
jgi:hypothetical protein